MVRPGGEAEDRAGLRPLPVRDRDRRDETEVGDDAEDAQVRQHRRLDQHDRDQQQRRGARTRITRHAAAGFEHAHDRRARRRRRAARTRIVCSIAPGALLHRHHRPDRDVRREAARRRRGEDELALRHRRCRGARVEAQHRRCRRGRWRCPSRRSSRAAPRRPSRVGEQQHRRRACPTPARRDRRAVDRSRPACPSRCRVGSLVERDRRLEVAGRAGDRPARRRRRGRR